MNDFVIGNTRLNSMTAVLTNLQYLNNTYGLHIDGILGYDFFSKGTICLNFIKKTMGIRFYNPEEK
jgi:hypothetical protein